MYAVGRLSSYITRGVSTVSGPFHPFGGAIDIVVVQQQDGSLRSSPWYVRFGKFQGVLKAREKVVDIKVNGVESGFHMYLNPRGEAYFLKEDETHSNEATVTRTNSSNMDCNYNHCNSLMNRSGSQAFSRNLGVVIERKSLKDDKLKEDDKTSAEIAADLLERKWATNLSDKPNDNCEGHDKNDGEMTSGKLEASLVLHEEHFVTEENDKDSEVVKEVDQVIVANVDADGTVQVFEACGEALENDILKEEKRLKVEESYTEVACVPQENVSQTDDGIKSVLESNGQLHDNVDQKSTGSNHESDSSPLTYEQVLRFKRSFRRFRSDTDLTKSYEFIKEEVGAHSKSMPNLWSHLDEFDLSKLDDSTFYSLDSKRRFSKWDLLRKDASRIIKEGSNDTKSNDGKGDASVNNKSWSLWPFSRQKTKRLSQKEHYPKKNIDLDSASELDAEKDHLSKSFKMRKELAPTSEQLESLKLNEGKNTVTFTFSTSVLGNQQVDARIFLWRWDTRIVISDVDGTITKSDVLGQFMPLVGKDWSHIGVTHLFSAIKENGYEILFLSARSVSQADITRQFLINLKQEGKTLPEGPVVISPDGLFPSLFREVIRRAPHEFKIACLEDIRACFPPDWNPFYAGFGNRDTDEFSYLKVGISKGKIFIINPKGEVVVNRSHETKSYSSLHTMVNDIFPPISAHNKDETAHEKDETTHEEEKTAHDEDKTTHEEDKTTHEEDKTTHHEDKKH